MLDVISFFSGIGAFEKALTNMGVNYNLVNYCEIDKYASKSYATVHNVPESLNLGDITKVNTAELPKNIDLLTYGFPCQDISLAGKQKGLFNEDGTQTRSGLFFEALRVIEDVRPKVAIAENVKNLVSKKFSEQFEIVLNSLEQAGYNNYWQVLNAKDYGVPQNRERVFIISIRKDIDKGFKFPEPFELQLRLKDLLESEVDEKYYLDGKYETITEFNNQYSMLNGGVIGKMHDVSRRAWNIDNCSPTIHTCGGGNTEPKVIVKENTKKGYTEALAGDSINFEQPNSKTRRGRVGKQVAQTLTTAPAQGVVETVQFTRKGNAKTVDVVNTLTANDPSRTLGNNNPIVGVTDGLRIRKLTPLECWRLMGFDDEDFYKAEKVNSNSQLYKQAGNSIVVDVIEEIYEQLFTLYWEDLK